MFARVWAKPASSLSSATCRAGSPGSCGRVIHSSASKSMVRNPIRPNLPFETDQAPERRDLVPAERARAAYLDPAGVEPCVARAAQPRHRMADRLAHAAHLAVAALVQHELHPRAAELARPGRSGDAVLELDSVCERRDGRRRQ